MFFSLFPTKPLGTTQRRPEINRSHALTTPFAEHDVQWLDDTRKVMRSTGSYDCIPYNLMISSKATRMKNYRLCKNVIGKLSGFIELDLI